MTHPMSEGIRLATPAELQALIAYVYAKVAASPQYGIDMSRILADVMDCPYPTETDTENQVTIALCPQHTVSLSFSLGFLCGMLSDSGLCMAIEVLLRVLESLGLQGLSYGVGMPEKGNGEGPYFIVEVPSTPQQHLRYSFDLDKAV